MILSNQKEHDAAPLPWTRLVARHANRWSNTGMQEKLNVCRSSQDVVGAVNRDLVQGHHPARVIDKFERKNLVGMEAS